MEPSPYATPDTARLLTLFASHVRQHGWQAPGAGSFEAFAAQTGVAVLVFSDDPRRAPECWDVAVILPDLVRQCVPQARVALLDPQASRALAPRYGVCLWPSLVFLRDGSYLGTIERMRDWDDYAGRIGEILAREPSDPPQADAPPAAAAAHAH